MKRTIHGTLASIAVLALALSTITCGKKSSNPVAPPGPAADVVINILAGSSQAGANAYSPNPRTVTVGTKVAWKNNDGMIHTSTSNPGAFTWNTGNVSPGATSAAVTMTTAGTFGYFCSVVGHNMTGTLVVQ